MGVELVLSSARGVGTRSLALVALIALPVALALLAWDYYRRRATRRPHRRTRRPRPPEMLPRRPRVVRRGGRRR